MQKTCTLCKDRIGTELVGDHAGKQGNLDGVVEHILTVTGTELQTAEQAYKLCVDAVDTDLKDSTFTGLLDDGINFTAGFFHHFLNAGGMNTTVGNEFFQSETSNLTADRVKAGQSDRLRHIVDDQIDAGQRFNGTDISALTTDDTALHFIVGKVHNGNGCLGHHIGRKPLDSEGDDVGSFCVCFFS